MEQNIEQEIKLTPSKQLQAKLTTSLSGKTSEQLVEQIRDALQLGEFQIEPASTEVIDDEYFDTAGLSLNSCQASVRFRRLGGAVCLTIKKMRSHEPGQLDREELTETLTEQSAHELVETGFRRVLRENFPDLDHRIGLKSIVRIRNNRKNFSLARRDAKFQMSVDQFRYETVDAVNPSKQYFEIEIEALNDSAREQLPAIKRRLRNAIDLSYSDWSKYERAIREVVHISPQVHGGRPDAPSTLESGVMREVWGMPPLLRRTLLITAILTATIFAIWVSLPDSTKERLLGGQVTSSAR